MKTKRNLTLITLVALPFLASACGGYGNYKPIELNTRHLALGGNPHRMTSETYTYYTGADGKEVRHGNTFQFDGAGNLIAQSTWRNGKVWSGSRATIGMGCGIYARRTYYKAGVSIGRERLKGKILHGDKNRLGFEVNREQLEFAGMTVRPPETAPKRG